jgi:hypothetical protein
MRRVPVPLIKELGAADRAKWKKQSGFSSSNRVNPDRPDEVSPYRSLGRIFHAGMKYPGYGPLKIWPGGVGCGRSAIEISKDPELSAKRSSFKPNCHWVAPPGTGHDALLADFKRKAHNVSPRIEPSPIKRGANP